MHYGVPGVSTMKSIKLIQSLVYLVYEVAWVSALNMRPRVLWSMMKAERAICDLPALSIVFSFCAASHLD